MINVNYLLLISVDDILKVNVGEKMGASLTTSVIILAGLFGQSPAQCIREIDNEFSSRKTMLDKKLEKNELEEMPVGSIFREEWVREREAILKEIRRLESSYLLRIQTCSRS